MFTVIATTNFGKNWEMTCIDDELAYMLFDTARKAVDCASAIVIDATTGEVLAEYEHNKLTYYNE